MSDGNELFALGDINDTLSTKADDIDGSFLSKSDIPMELDHFRDNHYNTIIAS